MLESGGGGGGWAPVQYQVTIDSLADFVNFIEREVNYNLDPGLSRIQSDYSHGLLWGLTVPGQVVRASREGYSQAQQLAVDNMIRYVLTGAAMRETIERLMETYKTAEEMATVSTEQVQGALTLAYQRNYAALQAQLNPQPTATPGGQVPI